MISIGEFSRICGVTTRTLRHYDSIGLIKPLKVDESSGYRSYALEQLRQMLLINRLKSYGFSLEEIAGLLTSGDNDLLAEKIAQKSLEARRKSEEYQRLEWQMERDLMQMKKGFDIMAFIDQIEVTLSEVEERHILHSRQRMRVDDYCRYIGGLFGLAQHEGLRPVGAPMSIYHDREFDPADNDTEVALPVERSCEHTRVLAGGLCATALCSGPYSNLPNAYARLLEWTQENGYVLASAPYEQYEKGPMEAESPEEFVTRIYFPLQKK